ncbi:MAG: hypothetical protein A2942_02990 [Candidatus Lloydbacteria bacterium RIFCSPLOWO2_01_FULL_50_20]|uniref:LTD domain-containing protein n=1 Tax=Candidatus Lloydbacteria bacterium RIFCSPLOWO2_01_FULL_50_20 TaxID=1798665 RepID=A0A1G2DGS0_9BACT|nr:MAG: hypothetical protein A3C13_01725 [Candidatus Lloydbacteria bacterium RIFCSPHIGHO2_02_FULL_50_11]OGZ12835.1 MAG: hypothetical protein A2942_02990 [Candidatus Lloydbacteria bacterium RIFCSPLOWO2_01_FULL_50_20]
MFITKKGAVTFRSLFFAVFFFGIAQDATAVVRINEIAWMGSRTSSAREWIELANDTGEPVSLSGWRIEAEDGSPNIVLSGEIGPYGYFLIERTNDDAIPGISADLVISFGRGLENNGEVLTLKDGTGTLIDTVAGGKNWVNVGGDNSTKQTPQRLEDSASGWTTGVPTPRAKNILPEAINTAVKGTQEKAPVLSPKTTTTEQKSALAPEKENASPAGTTTVLWQGNEASPGANSLFGVRTIEWLLVVFGLLLSILAGFIIYRSGQKEVSPADEYVIIESADD